MFAALGSVATGVALNLLLVPAFGIFGAGAAMAAAIVLVNVVTLLSVRRFLGFWPYSTRYAKPVIAGLLATLSTYLARLILPAYVGTMALLIFVPLFLSVFAALLVVLGLDPSDRHFLASFWVAVRRNISRTTPKGA
jgi:O-antigen/teichoic acid export membrane protein